MPNAKRVKSSKRPNFADEFKRALVEQTFEPDASVSLVARRNDVNTNLLFRWRRQYLEGAFGLPRPEHVALKPTDGIPTLLPVSLVDETAVPTCYGALNLRRNRGRLSRVRRERFSELRREHRETPRA